MFTFCFFVRKQNFQDSVLGRDTISSYRRSPLWGGHTENEGPKKFVCYKVRNGCFFNNHVCVHTCAVFPLSRDILGRQFALHPFDRCAAVVTRGSDTFPGRGILGSPIKQGVFFYYRIWGSATELSPPNPRCC